MEVISRQAARDASLTKFFTGKLCRNGHLAPRYVVSGSCSVCTNGTPKRAPGADDPPRDPATAPTEGAASTVSERAHQMHEARLSVTTLKHRVFHLDYPAVAAFALALCRMRFPLLPADQFRIRPTSTKAQDGHAMYEVRYPLEDHAQIVAMTRALFARQCATPEQVESFRHNALTRVADLVPVAEGPYDRNPT